MTAAPRDDSAALIDVVTAFGRAEVAPRVVAFQSSDSIERALLSRLVTAGLWNVGLPETIGGQGADLLTSLRAMRELARVSPSLAMALVHAHATAAALQAAAGGVEAARRVAAGSVVAVCFAERSAGPAVCLPRVDLGLQPDQILVVDVPGEVTYLVGAPVDAPAARRSGLLGLGTRSVECERDRMAATAELSWTGPAHRDAARAAAAWWTVGTVVCGLGTAMAAIDQASSYVHLRRQFGAPLIEIPTVARAVAMARQDLCDASAAVWRQSARSGGISEGQARRTANIAVRLCVDAVQLFGGYGYLREYVVEGLLRDAVSLRAAARVVPASAGLA